MPPLPLDSPRWNTLKSHFARAEGEAAHLTDVPKLISDWTSTVGTYAEEYAYSELAEAYLHQRTILDVAYAVVPHVAARVAALAADRRLAVLDDLSFVESVRVRDPKQVEVVIARMRETLPPSMVDDMVQNTRNRNPALAEDLAPAYLEALETTRRAALALVAETRDGEAFQLLLSTICRLHGHARFGTVLDDLAHTDIADRVKAWSAEQPPSPRHWRRHVAYLRAAGWYDGDVRVGVEALTRDEGTLLFAGPPEARTGLPEVVPAAWLAKTRVAEPDGLLAFRALYAIAWLRRVPLETVLARP